MPAAAMAKGAEMVDRRGRIQVELARMAADRPVLSRAAARADVAAMVAATRANLAADHKARAARTTVVTVLAVSVAAGTVAAIADTATRAVVAGMADILAGLVGM